MLGLGLGLTGQALRRGGPAFSPASLSPLAWARTPAQTGSACSITLTGDIAAAFGGQPLDISGQMVSKTVPASPANFYAAGGSASQVTWTGWRGIAYQTTDFTTAINSFLGFILISSDYAKSAQLTWQESLSSWLLLVDGSVVAGPIAESVDAKVGFRIDGSTGDVELYIGATAVTKSTVAALGGVFSGKSVIPAPTVGTPGSPTLTAGDTYAAQIFTAAADLTDVGFPAGTLDWCDNPIDQPVPGLYQDSAGTTPVTGAGQDIGAVDDQGSVGGLWSQVTGTARPTYEIGPARRVYDPDDALPRTLPANSGGQIVIISPAGTWIDDFDFAGGTFTVGPDTYTGGPAGLMSLLGNEEIEIIILPTPMTEAERAKMVEYAQGLGSAGLITFGSELVVNFGTNAAAWSGGVTATPLGSQTVEVDYGAFSNGYFNFIGTNPEFLSDLVSGKRYLVSVEYQTDSPTNTFPQVQAGTGLAAGATTVADGWVRLYGRIVAGATNRLAAFCNDPTDRVVRWRGLTVREVIMP